MEFNLIERMEDRLYPFLNYKERERIKNTITADKNLDWCKYYDNMPLNFRKIKVGTLSGKVSAPLIPTLDDYLKNKKGLKIVQLGSCSGKEINYLASRHPQNKFVGFDISEDIVRYANSKYKAKNFKFICSAEPLKMLVEADVFFSVGSIQYVQPEDIANIFEKINQEKIKFFIEDCFNVYKKPQVLLSSYRGRFSWSHDYQGYALDKSLAIEKSCLISPYGLYNDPKHIFVVGGKI